MSKDILKQIKLISGSNVCKTPTKRHVKTSHLTDDDVSENQSLIFNIGQYVLALKDFYDRAERASRYHRGDQWSDRVLNDDDEMVTEESIIEGRGKIPLKNNMIGQIIKNLSGQFAQSVGKAQVISRQRSRQKDGEMLSQALQTAYDFNRIKILDINTITEGMITGMFCQKVLYKYQPELDDEEIFVSKPTINRMFYNSDISDVRTDNDIRIIGELHDMPLDEIVLAFALSEEDEDVIRSWYSYSLNEMASIVTGLEADWNIDVMLPTDPSMSRVIEVWQKKLVRRVHEHDTLYGTKKITTRTIEDVEQENQERIQLAADNGVTTDVPIIIPYERYETVWTVKYLTPFGQVLYEGETPYSHQSHPYIVSFAQFVNGEAWGLVEDIIDQQRYINRLISMLDFMMGIAAKGVLLVPEDSIPDDMSLDDITDEWSKFDGVIKFKAKPGVPLPQQISANITNIGANEQLAIQFDLIEKISGVSGAMQGHGTASGTPSSLYAQQTINSSTNSKAMFESFADFRRQRDNKALKVIVQYYDSERYLAITGSEYQSEAVVYNPERVKGLRYDVLVNDGVDTPAYKMMMDEQLKGLLEAGAIDAKMYLQNSSYPFSDKLLAALEGRTEESKEAQDGADQQQVAQVNQMIGNN